MMSVRRPVSERLNLPHGRHACVSDPRAHLDGLAGDALPREVCVDTGAFRDQLVRPPFILQQVLQVCLLHLGHVTRQVLPRHTLCDVWAHRLIVGLLQVVGRRGLPSRLAG